jgi:cytochrome c oxidase cbb3-type subunit III
MEENKKSTTPEYDPVTKDKFVEHHEFDGIRELANEPPYWLSFIFILSVVFSYAYIAKYHIFKSGDLQIAEYQSEMARFSPEEEESDLMALRPKETEESLVVLTDMESLNAGRQVFTTNCAVCHLQEGQGLVGPNLTDDYWIHGGSYSDIVTLIRNGVPAKGMISWKTQISNQQILEVASYVMTLRGSNPPNPKAPQGELYVPEE